VSAGRANLSLFAALGAQSAVDSGEVDGDRAVKFRFWHLSLLFAPAALVLYWFNTNGATTGRLSFWLFGVSLVALLPLAQINGDIVEVLAKGRSQIVSGLMNAFLGNIPEIAIGFWLLMQVVRHPDLTDTNYTIVHGLLLGSVINNILLTLGLATFAGAWRHGRLRFSQERAAGFASMLGLAVVGLALPTLATAFADQSKELLGSYTEEAVSLVVCVILFMSYIAYILVEYFHFGDRIASEKVAEAGPATAEHHAAHHQAEAEHHHLTAAEEAALLREEEARQAREREMALTQSAAKPLSTGITALMLTLLVISIAAIAGVCATLVTVTDRVIVASPLLTPLSFGLIVLPIICNFGELFEAAQMAWGKRMEEAMEVAAGSSVQVPLFVTPVLVFIGFIFALLTPGLQQFTLVFKPLELVTVGLVVFVYALVNLDGETTWLEGVQLAAFYAMIALTAFALPGR
jgi:Ca2+:H+ antiporter